MRYWSATTPSEQVCSLLMASTSPQATLASAHLALADGDAVAIDALRPEVTRLFGTADAVEGVQSFVERRAARFAGC